MLTRLPHFHRVIFVSLGLIMILLLASCAANPPASAQGDTNESHRSTLTSPTTQPDTNTNTTPTPKVCVENAGSIQDLTIPSSVLDDDIKVKLYLPACYDEKSTKRYSVLYMLHGQNSQEDQWVRVGLFAKMDELIRQGTVEPFIIVLPNELRSNLEAIQSLFGDAVLEDVIPYVDEHFNTCNERVCRAIGGLSRGGNWAVHLGFEHPELFKAVGAHSTPLFYGEMINITRAVEDPDRVGLLPVVYIDVGHKDPDRDDVIYFLTTIQKLPIQYQFNEYLGYHDEIYWSAHAADYLKFYNGELVPPRDQ